MDQPRIEGLVRALRVGGDIAKMEAAAQELFNLTYGHDANRVLVAEAGGIPPLVDLLRDGSARAKRWAAIALYPLTKNDANKVLVAEAGGIPPLVDLLRDGSAGAKRWAVRALGKLACNDDNLVLIAEAGAIPRLLQLMPPGSTEDNIEAAEVLSYLADDNDANMVAIAVAVGLEALVGLARDGFVAVDHAHATWLFPEDEEEEAGVPAKRKAALVVAALLRDYVPGFKSAPRDIKTAIGSYL